MIESIRPTFRAIATSVVPEAARLDEAGWAEVEKVVEDALSRRPAALRKQLRLFIGLLDAYALLRHGRMLRALAPSQRLHVLEAMENAPVLLFRRGIWGLRTLIFMGYYVRPSAAAEIGYRAEPRGWEARRQPA